MRKSGEKLFAPSKETGKHTTLQCSKKQNFRLPKTFACSQIPVIKVCSKEHENSQTPTKKPKGGELSPAQRCANRELSRARIMVENVIRHLKIFRIISSRYRNGRRRFGLRFNLIAGLYNYEIDH